MASIFDIWAPRSAAWSSWVKPVVFSEFDSMGQADAADAGKPVSQIDAGWIKQATGDCAMVVDLPGPQSVQVGMALARKGYRPVPLYNSIPPRSAEEGAVDLLPLMRALRSSTDTLAALPLHDQAPPAFLLDAGRQRNIRPIAPGVYDNRSLSFPSDFPSAQRLRAAGIRSIVLVQEVSGRAQVDLEHTLRAWQDGRLVLFCKRAGDALAPVPMDIKPHGPFSLLALRLSALFVYKKNLFGGFGGYIPHRTAG